MNRFFVISGFLLGFILFSGEPAVLSDDLKIVCSSCSYENQDSDRYCLNCAMELRKLSFEDKKQLQNQEHLRKERQKIRQQIALEKQSSKVSVSKKRSGSDIKKEIAKSSAHLNYHLKIPKISGSFKLGDSKSKIKKHFKSKRSLFKKDEVSFEVMSKMMGKYSHQSERQSVASVLMGFEDGKLNQWKIEKTGSFLINHVDNSMYPLNKNDIKTGMSYSEVKKLWGTPAYTSESNDLISYQLTLSFPVQGLTKDWDTDGVKYSFKGGYFKVEFDDLKNVKSVSKDSSY